MGMTAWFLSATLLLASGCSSSTSTSGSANEIVGNWINENAQGTTGIAFDAKADGTYVLETLVQTSPTTFNAEVETGTWTSTSSSLTTTPKQWSCAGADPVSTVSYSFNGGDLIVSLSTGIVSFKPNTATASSTGQTLSQTNGCFDQSGNFTPHALGPTQ